MLCMIDLGSAYEIGAVLEPPLPRRHAGPAKAGSALHSSKNPQHAHPHRAIARAVSAAGAENLAELLPIDAELVVNPLALACGLVGPWVVAGSVEREHRELARIPVPGAHAALDISLVDDIETMARRAGVRTSATAEAGQRLGRPEGAVEMLLHKGLHLLRLEALFRPRRNARHPLRGLHLALEQRFPLLCQAADFVHAVAQFQQHGVRAALGSRPQAHRCAETRVIVGRAGQRYDCS